MIVSLYLCSPRLNLSTCSRGTGQRLSAAMSSTRRGSLCRKASMAGPSAAANWSRCSSSDPRIGRGERHPLAVPFDGEGRRRAARVPPQVGEPAENRIFLVIVFEQAGRLSDALCERPVHLHHGWPL
jgi:hypothetical protein